MKHEPKLTFATLTALVLDTVQYLEMNKTFRNEEDVIHAVKFLSEEFPAMKLEEWKIVMDRLKTGQYGKMYERFKLPEMVEVFKQFEGERAEMMEKNLQREKDAPPSPMSEESLKMLRRLAKDLDLPEDDTDSRGRWKHIEYPNSDGKQETDVSK